MSIQSSRFLGQQVINSFNIFIDSEKSSVVGDKQSKGDDIHLHLEGNSIEAGDGEFIRISLLNFNMFNTLYNIDKNSSQFTIKGTHNTNSIDKTLSIPRKNYNNFKDIAEAFGNAIITHLDVSAGGGWTMSAKPEEANVGQTSDRLLEIDISNASNAITNFEIVLELDSYIIFGGNRIDPGSNIKSLKITSTNSNKNIKIQGYYPMTRTADPYIYIRSSNVQNGLETSVLSNDQGNFNADIISSNILGRVFKDVEFITYDSPTGEEYFMNLQQKKLSNLKLTLTDSKGRRLGRTGGERYKNTGAGLISNNEFESDYQNTQGNLFFTAVLKVDIVKWKSQHYLETPELPPPLPARQAQSVLTWADYGMPKL